MRTSGKVSDREYVVISREMARLKYFCGYVEIKEDELDLLETIADEVDNAAYRGITFEGKHEELGEKYWVGFDTLGCGIFGSQTYANGINLDKAIDMTRDLTSTVERIVKKLNEKGANTGGALQRLIQARKAINIAEDLIEYRIEKKAEGDWDSKEDEANRLNIIQTISDGIEKLGFAGNRLVISQ